ncbi:TnsA-like heteromeric transposase endonuclease subunit [Microbacterium sp.]|uniref:TnsA-like heteromeric transposase endonuclease subunit n=1 Tax=Microbacterium sp. TaxID=51671 RepID=UPI00281145ED|nr:TnsA-like heteromeric transposase endonuclease subunit [Microbacterium sp.]
MSVRPATIQIRKSADHVESIPITDARLRLFESAVPWREFRWYKGQRHFSGNYWSATMDAPVGYESRLEYANLLLLDFDPRVRRLLSQPFLIEGDDRGTTRRHIPDFLIAHADESVCVVDVKPAEKLSLPKVRDSLRWSRRVIEAHGWEYRVLSEPDPILFANVQFLAGYRRAFQFIDKEVAAAIESLRTPQTFGEAVEFVQPITGDRRRARALVLHLIWTRLLGTDLTLPLGRTSLLEPGRVSPGRAQPPRRTGD